MLQSAEPQPPRRFDPARDAARLLGYAGVTILMVGAPVLSVVSRRALFVLLPVGACVLLAALAITLTRDGLGTLRDLVRQPIALAALGLVGWMGLSIVWTPYPGVALPHYAATLVIAALATLVVAYLPERRARPALYLLPAGLTVTSLTTLAMAFLGPDSFRGGSEFDSSLLEHSVLTIVVLVWPALGALAVFGRWVLAILLAILVADVVMVAQAPLAMAAFMLGAVTFALTGDAPRRVAVVVAAVFCGLVAVAPLLPFALAPLAASIPMVGRSTVAAMQDWRGIVASDPLRLLTGHGLDLARFGAALGYLPPHTPRSILFEIWYDLGVVGALSFAGVFSLGILAASRAASFVAPALLGGLVATLSIALFGVATAELWFITLGSLQAIAFGLLARSSRGDRPAAVALDTLPDAAATGATIAARPALEA
jgi:hypothetical protein